MKSSQKTVHIIRIGDSIKSIAKQYNTKVSNILSQNPNINPRKLKSGAHLIIKPGKNIVNNNLKYRPDPRKQIMLINDMRLSWSQHVALTRMLLISIAHKLNDQTQVRNRLLENPTDIARIFSGYYSTNIGNKIRDLLTEYLEIGGKLIVALRDKKEGEAKRLEDEWYKNADQMADAFSSTNPHYDNKELKQMLHSHLLLTTQEVELRLAGEYSSDILAFDRVEQQAMAMADYFASGLMKQFPNRFT